MNKSTIDPTKPAENAAVPKSDLRGNFAAAKAEIDELFRRTRLPWLVATGVVGV